MGGGTGGQDPSLPWTREIFTTNNLKTIFCFYLIREIIITESHKILFVDQDNKMAAIIAQISLQAAKRRRDTFKRIPIEKSNAFLPPFDQHFEPKKHNVFTKR